LEASVESAAGAVVGSVGDIAAELDVKVFGVVDFAVVEVTVEVVYTSEWVYAHSRL
jgi:DNA-binding transcriptional regulator YdaS (Cro superfamily)